MKPRKPGGTDGPAQPSAARPGLEKEYRIEAFDINISERKALCPAGKQSAFCSKLTEQKSGKVTYRFEFGSHCHDCPHRVACVPSTQAHRTILVGAHHEVLQQRRREQQSQEFQLRMHQRNAIEGTFSELAHLSLLAGFATRKPLRDYIVVKRSAPQERCFSFDSKAFRES